MRHCSLTRDVTNSARKRVCGAETCKEIIIIKTRSGGGGFGAGRGDAMSRLNPSTSRLHS